METTQENSKTIKWNDFLDVNENDNFEFKLLDDGLGFHHHEEVEKKTSIVRKKVPSVPNLKSSPRRGVSRKMRPQKDLSHMREVAMPEIAMPEVSFPKENLPSLKTGYPKAQTSSIRKVQEQRFKDHQVDRPERTERKIKKKLKLASVEIRFSSFVLDLLFLAIGVLLFVIVGSFTLGVTLDSFAMTLLEPRYLPYLVTLLGSFYLFYFSLLDCDQSFGKKIMGIRVIDKNNRKAARFMQNATRAFLTILIVPVLFSLQDSMSDTEVIKCN